MANYYGINENYAASFFNRNHSSSGSTSVNSSGSVLSQYASIRDGSYGKLLKAYYQKYGTNSVATGSQDTKAELTSIKEDAKDLVDSAESLYKNGTDSVFTYDAVKSFTDDYNQVLESAGEAENTAVLRSASNMTQVTKANKELLSGIGISIQSDNTLSVDEDTFKKADMNTIKSLFSGTGSYAYTIGAKASNIQYAANSALSSGQMYSNSGDYSALTTGTLYDSLF